MAALASAVRLLVLLCGDWGLGPHDRPTLAVADLAAMMKEIGATELTPEMIAKGTPVKPKRKTPPKPKPLDPVEVIEQTGMDVNRAMADKIRASPEKVKEAEEETIAEVTQLAMYRQVRCSGCKAVAEVLAADLVSSWRPTWTKETFLEHVQGFCDSASFLGEYQVMVRNESLNEQPPVYVLRKSTEEKPTSKHSLATLRRICREHVDDRDRKAAKEASMAISRALREVGDDAKLQEMLAQKPTPSGGLQTTLELVFCKRICKSKRRKAVTEDNAEL